MTAPITKRTRIRVWKQQRRPLFTHNPLSRNVSSPACPGNAPSSFGKKVTERTAELAQHKPKARARARAERSA